LEAPNSDFFEPYRCSRLVNTLNIVNDIREGGENPGRRVLGL
jgi:hypothetical protein